ncbi:hypothetical protein QQ008_00770 [Fulvivirgaceae bacterium BMA10]|uniref:Glycosyltransferase RgtA/B/C/D-like domain-containing protein n=1 Tax=Splendidivirga corallicola TaxID=3051826 RepID=A0ABT8KIJ3_9BACT|nr:hypothetical protein [Fulvivirgaceae bacterium BMA10]
MNKPGWLLFLLYIGIVLVILIRVYVERTNYTTPDSHFYLRAAENLNSGKGIIAPYTYPFDDSNDERYFAIWPIGYPTLIAFVSRVTSTSTLISSKILNLIFLGFIFLLLYNWFGKFAWFPALYFCSYNMLEVFSYTWSEGPFLFFVLLLGRILIDDLSEGSNKYLILKLSSILVSLFLLRYAGLIYFLFVGGLLILHIRQGNKRKSIQYFFSLLASSLLVIIYLGFNYLKTGYLTGGERVFPKQESFSHFFSLLGKGVLNELTIARNYYFDGKIDYIYILLLLLQLSVVFILIKRRSYMVNYNFGSLYPKTLLYLGLFYFVLIIILRKITPFDPFDYRILSPFSVPIYIGLFVTLSKQVNIEYFKKISIWASLFMLISLAANLPKMYILGIAVDTFNQIIK